MENNSLEEDVKEELIDEETEKLLCRLDKKIKICNIVTIISTVVLLYSVYHIRRYGTDLLNAGSFICSLILALGGLMSIFCTQKVKLFYAALLANNSH